MKLARGDPVTLDRVRLSKESAHVFHESARYAGRQVYRFTGHEQDIGKLGLNCESNHPALPHIAKSHAATRVRQMPADNVGR
jgi:hypothetical protein